MWLATVVFVTLAIAHSVLGELKIMKRMLSGFKPESWIFGVIRAAWHLTSVAWLGLAIVLQNAPALASTLCIAVVAAISGVSILVASRGRHLAWVLFELAAVGILHSLGSTWVATSAAIVASATLAIIALVHLAWALGWRRGLETALPRDLAGDRPLKPGPLATLIVSALFAVGALVPLWVTGLFAGPSLARPLAWLGVLVLTLRTVGDFKFVGLFKRLRSSAFASADDAAFTPLTSLLASAYVLMLG